MEAIPKKDKQPNDPKSYWPIALLYHLHKVFERLTQNRLTEAIDPVLIPQQASTCLDKSCTSQVLTLTQKMDSNKAE